tara:strand:+ start:908 stop:1582 length:675 start_codon:yes stop_codon:yes gene_type:complete
MKKTNKLYSPFFILLLVVFILGCKKDEKVELPGVPSFVSKEIIEDFRNKGLVVNEGIKPPKLEGFYLVSPNTLLVPYGPEDGYKVGRVVSDYRYSFYGQTSNNEIKYDYKSTVSDSGTGTGSFISGKDNLFTIYSEQVGVSLGIDTKTVTIISGELANNGIKNWQEAFVITYKGDDPDNKLIKVGQGRIYNDGDSFSERVSSLRLNLESLKPSTSDESIFSNKK